MDRDMRDRGNRPGDERDMGRMQGRAGGARQGEDEYALDELVEIIRIILLEESRPVPMRKQLRMVDVDKALSFLDALNNQMPRAIPQSRRILEDRDNIIKAAERKANDIYTDADNRARVAMDDAQKSAQAIIAEAEVKANQIIDEAQKQARVLVDQSEVRRIAESEANKLMASARDKANETVRQATQYTDSMLSNLEDFLNVELGDVQKSRANINAKRLP